MFAENQITVDVEVAVAFGGGLRGGGRAARHAAALHLHRLHAHALQEVAADKTARIGKADRKRRKHIRAETHVYARSALPKLLEKELRINSCQNEAFFFQRSDLCMSMTEKFV